MIESSAGRLGHLVALFVLLGEPCIAQKPVVFGKDQMQFDFPRLGDKSEKKRVIQEWTTNCRIDWSSHGGSPFRAGVELGAYRWVPVHINGEPDEIGNEFPPKYIYCREKRDYCTLSRDSVGGFLERVQNVKQMEFLIRLLHPRSRDWLSGEQLRQVVREIEAAGKELPFKIVRREIEDEASLGHAFQNGDCWLMAVLTIEGASVFEYKYAVNEFNQIAKVRRLMVLGPDKPVEPILHRSLLGRQLDAVPEEYTIWREEHARCVAVLVCGACGGKMGDLLKEPDPKKRDEACRWLESGGEAAVPTLIKAMNDPVRDVRLTAIDSLNGMRSKATAALPALRQALAGKDRGIRVSAAIAMYEIGDAKTRLEVIPVIEKMGPDAGRAIDVVRFATNDKDKEVGSVAKAAYQKLLSERPPSRADIERYFREFGPLAQTGVVGLMKALDNPDSQIQEFAIEELGKNGAAAAEAIPRLRKLALSRSWTLRPATVVALGQIGKEMPKEVLPDLKRALSDELCCAREKAAQALGGIGAAAKDLLPDLEWAKSDPVPSVQRAANDAIQKIQAKLDATGKK